MNIKKDINNIHDKSYKDLFSNKEVFINLVQNFVKNSWSDELREENLELVNKSYILSDYEELESDIVYKANMGDNEVVFYVLLEFQSSVDYSMPIRLFLYMAEIWREFLKNTEKGEVKRKDFRLPAIVPLVLYNGEYKWTVERRFKNIINKSKLFGNNIIDFEYILFDINKYEKEELVQLGNISSAIFLLDQKVDFEEFISRIKDIALYFDRLTEEEKMILKHWLRTTLSDDLKNIIGEELESVLTANKGEVLRMTSNISKTIRETFERVKEEGIEQGIKKGREEGREQARLRDVKRVLKLVNRKFNYSDRTFDEKIKKANSDELNLIIENILDIERMEDLTRYLS
ncbi:Rpn family recombination-promoting nuclease/putative transposase [Clostridium sp. WILCCON 0269]|uniref:Rpn family recombination-promoting nuclease/putative transposase n=1 Tax=Candidatus Clostridium eludens TaxID=3381663 RepID=A0ABW8SGD1_9CLOT